MRRRSFLKRGVALASCVGLTGCLNRLGFETQSAWRDPPQVENRPDAVYYPAIVEGMGTYGTVTKDGLGVALIYSYPHRFWNLTGTRKEKVVVRSNDSLHLMASVWDAKSGTILPIDLSVTIENSDGKVTSTNLWPMISPNMGFHYGDNVALAGEGKYQATIRVGPLQTDRTGDLAGKYTSPRSVTMEFTFDTSETYDLPIRRLAEKAGRKGTVNLMDMTSVPSPQVPPKEELPGRLIGEMSSDDVSFLVILVDGDSRFSKDSKRTLLVSPRTPYNRIMLPRIALTGTGKRGQKTVLKRKLRASIDSEIGCYYRAPVNGLETGDSIVLKTVTPPQLARHDGYETAFLDMPPAECTVSSDTKPRSDSKSERAMLKV